MKTTPDHTCRECGATENASNYYGGERLARELLCFTCDYWLRLIEKADTSTSVRINGTHYIIGRGNGGGFSGRRFDIEFFDGRTVTTYDLWHQGPILDRFKTRLPDNARFL